MRTVIAPVLVAFTALSLWIFGQTGILGFYAQLLDSPAAWQVVVDLALSLALVMAWVWHDARRHGRRFWPWLVAALLVGSIAPLVYLLRRPAGQPLP